MNTVFKGSEWDKFIQEKLLNTKVICSALLVTKQGSPVYSYDWLGLISNAETSQFLGIFNPYGKKTEEDICKKGFTITKSCPGGPSIKFLVFKKTRTSVYATSEGSREGLVVCNLPYGVLITAYCYPYTAIEAIRHVEGFCDLLRA